MTTKQIVFVPGKDPKPDEALYSQLLWRTLVEGVRRTNRPVADILQNNYARFHLVNWNDLYYHAHKDSASDIPWIDALIDKRSPTRQDIRDTNSWSVCLSRILLTMGDDIPFLLPLLPDEVQYTANDISRYFNNTDNVAGKVRELLKQTLRPMLEHQDEVLLIGHSLGSAIAYDTLWELSHQEGAKGKVDLLTLGSPLGMHYFKRRLLGMNGQGNRSYPDLIRYWFNLSAEGDVIAFKSEFRKCFHQMLELGLVESIKDIHHGIYNMYRSEKGLDCHRSYGYMVCPSVGNIIADWWKYR